MQLAVFPMYVRAKSCPATMQTSKPQRSHQQEIDYTPAMKSYYFVFSDDAENVTLIEKETKSETVQGKK